MGIGARIVGVNDYAGRTVCRDDYDFGGAHTIIIPKLKGYLFHKHKAHTLRSLRFRVMSQPNSSDDGGGGFMSWLAEGAWWLTKEIGKEVAWQVQYERGQR